MSEIQFISKCPSCGCAALSKWDSSGYGLFFDACPSCMYLVAKSPESPNYLGRVETWDMIIKALGFNSLKELRDDMKSHQIDALRSPVFRFYPNYVSGTKRLGGERVFNLQGLSKEDLNKIKPSQRAFNKQKRNRIKFDSNGEIEF